MISDGEVRRGHGGFAGEVADVLTTGADGRASAFLDVFAHLGLRRADSIVIDVAALTAEVEAHDGDALAVISAAVGGVVRAAVALTDPQHVVLGGPWGSHPLVVAAVVAEAAGLPRAVSVRAATVTDEAPLAGARTHAIDSLRAAVLRRPADRS